MSYSDVENSYSLLHTEHSTILIPNLTIFYTANIQKKGTGICVLKYELWGYLRENRARYL